MLDKTTVAALARGLGQSWDTVNDIAVAATSELLLCAGPARLDGVRVIGWTTSGRMSAPLRPTGSSPSSPI